MLGQVKAVTIFGRHSGKSEEENDHLSLAEEWGDHPNAYMGITYPRFPNSFTLLGPGSGLGHNSILLVIECQVSYVIDAIKTMVTKNIKSIDLKKEVNDKYQAWAEKHMQKLVFTSTSCISYYKNAAGYVFALWPSHLTLFWWVTRKIDVSEYNCIF